MNILNPTEKFNIKNSKFYSYLRSVKFNKILRMILRCLFSVAIITLTLTYSFEQTREYKSSVYYSGLFTIMPSNVFSEKHAVFSSEQALKTPSSKDVEFLINKIETAEASFADAYNYYLAIDDYLNSLNKYVIVTPITKNDILHPDSNPYSNIDDVVTNFNDVEMYCNLITADPISLVQVSELFYKVEELSQIAIEATTFNTNLISYIDKILQAETLTLRSSALFALSMAAIFITLLFSSEILFRTRIKNITRQSNVKHSIKRIINDAHEEQSHISNRFIKNPKKLKEKN